MAGDRSGAPRRRSSSRRLLRRAANRQETVFEASAASSSPLWPPRNAGAARSLIPRLRRPVGEGHGGGTLEKSVTHDGVHRGSLLAGSRIAGVGARRVERCSSRAEDEGGMKPGCLGIDDPFTSVDMILAGPRSGRATKRRGPGELGLGRDAQPGDPIRSERGQDHVHGSAVRPGAGEVGRWLQAWWTRCGRIGRAC